MKPTILALSIAALGFSHTGALAGQVDDLTTSTIDLGGVVIQHGLNIKRDSDGDLIRPNTSYDYIITGTVTGSGALDFIEEGTDLAEALDSIQAGFSQNLSGIIINAKGKHPFTLVNKKLKGSFPLGPFTAKAKANAKAGIKATDEPFFSITGVSFTAGRISARPGDRITFDAGSTCTVLVPPASALPQQPDLLFSLGTQDAIGNNIYAGQTITLTTPKGHLAKCNLLIQNDGTSTDSFTLKGPAGDEDVSIKYSIGKTDITDAVVAGTHVVGPLDSRLGTVVTIKVKTKKPDATVEGTFTLTSTGNATKTDTFNFVVNESN